MATETYPEGTKKRKAIPRRLTYKLGELECTNSGGKENTDINSAILLFCIITLWLEKKYLKSRSTSNVLKLCLK